MKARLIKLFLFLLLLNQIVFASLNFVRLRAEILYSHGYFVEAMRLTPWNYEHQFVVGNFFATHDELDGAMAHYNKAINVFPFFFEAANNLGVIYAKKGNLQMAESIWRLIVKAQPEYWPAWKNLEALENLKNGEIKKSGSDL